MDNTTNIYAEYKSSPLGLIPNDWEVVKLGDLIDKIVGGGTPSRVKTEYWNGNIFWATVKDFTSYNPNSTEETITELGLKNSSSNLIPKGTLIIATRMALGKVMEYNIDVAINQDLKAIFPSKELDIKYLFYWFQKNVSVIEGLGNGSTVKGITLDDLKGIKCYKIPLPEQKAIASLLSTWDAAIQNNAQLIAQKELRKKWLMQQLLTGKKRLKGFSGEWKEYTFGDLGDSYNGLTGKTKDNFGSGFPFITYMNVFSNSRIDITQIDHVSISENENQNTAKFGDFFFTVSSETSNEVGMASVILDEVENLYLNSFCFGFRLFDFETLKPSFAQFLLRCDIFREEMCLLAQGSTRFNISKTGVKKIRISLPSTKEQTAIAQVLQAADKEIQLLKSKTDKLKEQKKGLMQVLLTGKKRMKIKK